MVRLDTKSLFERAFDAYTGICLNGRNPQSNGEYKIKEFGLSSLLGYIPETIRPILAYVLNQLGSKREAYAMVRINNSQMEKFMKSAVLRHELEDEVNRMIDDLSIDCIISPCGGLTPYRLGEV